YAKTLEEAAKEADYVIEAVYEKLETKQDLIAKIRPHLQRPDIVIASNTSSINIGLISPNDPWIVGMHFFSPVPAQKGVEVAAQQGANPTALEETLEIIKRIGKRSVRVKDVPAYAVNRLFIPFSNLAFHLADDGYSPATIDAAARGVLSVGASP